MKFQREDHHLFFTAHDEIQKRATIRKKEYATLIRLKNLNNC